MQARFVQDGDCFDYIPDVDVLAGDIVMVGDLVTITRLDIAAGTLGSLHRFGIHDIPKGEGVALAFAFGDPVYWNAATKKVGNAAGAGFVKIGICVSQTDDATCENIRFLLNA